MSFERKLIYKVYQENGTFIETLDDVVSDFTITKQINGGDSEFEFELDRKIDDFDEGTSIEFNNRVKVYLQDSFNQNGDKLIAYGYIVSYRPYMNGKKEGLVVTCLSAISKLSNDFYRTGTASAASDLGVELSSVRADEMMEAIITHYRSTETNSMLSSDFSNSDSTPDNTGGAITFDHRFFNMKHLDALREASKFLPKNKTGGYWFYWRISTDGKLYVKNISSSADHTFIISKHIKNISGEKSIEGIINRVYFWNEKGTVDPDYLKLTGDDSTSQTNYDIIADYITDSKITNPNAAGLLVDSKVYDNKDPRVNIEITLNGEYDLSSISPGDTCQILNLKNNPYKIGSDTVLVIHSISYNVDTAVLKLASAADNFEDIVEEERQRLDKELTWFGYITQQLTAAQLGPANRSWSTDIEFSATSGADAYRQVDWTGGTVYLPTSSGSAAGKRVIHSGSTGLMSSSTDYYIYLDEETINISVSSDDSGASGIIKQGGDSLTDSSKSWSNDQWKGYIVTIGGQTKIIKSNTATVLTIEDRWTIVDTTSTYEIRRMSFDVSSSKETISDLTKVIFSNVRANDNSDSEAIIVTTEGTSATSNLTIDGVTQVAKKSIVADNIYVTQLSAISANVGALTAGTIDGITITGGTIRTSSSGLRIELNSTYTNQINFYNSSTLYGQIEVDYSAPDGYIKFLTQDGNGLEMDTDIAVSGFNQSTLHSNGGAFDTYGTSTNKYILMDASKVGSSIFGINYSSGTYKLITDLRLDADWLPFASDTYDLGSATYKWQDGYFNGVVSVGGKFQLPVGTNLY